MAPLRTILLQDDFSLGMWRDVAPHRFDPRACYDHINGLYDEDGSPYKRGGSRAKSNTPFMATVVGRTNLARSPQAASLTPWALDPSGDFASVDVPHTDGLPAGVAKALKHEGSTHSHAVLPFSVESGKTYSVSLYTLWDGTGNTPQAFVVDDTFPSGDGVTGTVNFADGSAWRRLILPPFTADSTGTYSLVLERGVGAPSAYYATAVLIEEAAAAGSYFDGSFAGCRWSGTAHQSTSELLVAASGLRFLWDGYFPAGQRTVFASAGGFGVLGSDDETPIELGGDGLNAPAPAAYLKGLLFIGGGYIYGGSRKEQNYSTGTVSVTSDSAVVTGSGTAFEANVDPGMLLQIGDGRVYAVASVDSDTQLTLTEPYEGSTASGQSYELHNVYEIRSADPYVDAPFYAVVANRLVTGSENKVLFSEVNKPHKWTVTIEAEEIPNEHEVPLGTRILGVAAIQQTALIFTTRGIWTIDGLAFDIVDAAGNPQHRVALLAPDQILRSQVGIAGWQQALIVPCTDGVYLIDGISAPRRISHPIDELYSRYVDRGYTLGQAVTFRGHYLLPILSAGVVYDNLVVRLDHPVEARGQAVYPWSRFGGSGAEVAAYAVRAPDGAGNPLLLGAEAGRGALVLDCSRYFDLDSNTVADHDGTVHEWALVTRDFETGNGLENMVRQLFTRHELAGDGASIDFAYGFGLRRELPYAWDEWSWADDVTEDPNDLIWVEDDDDEMFDLDCPAGVSTGLDRHRCRVNKRARFIRFRIHSDSPCSRLRLRSLEVAIRPSAATRR